MKKMMTLLLLATTIVFTGCDWIKDLGEVDFSTDLVVTIPVTVQNDKKASLNFSASGELKLADNEDIEPYLKKLRKIDLNSVLVTVTGLTSGQTINTLSLDAIDVGTLFTQNNITSSNNSFTPQVNANILQQAGEKLKSDRKLVLTVSGTVSGPMVFNVGLVFESNITAGALD